MGTSGTGAYEKLLEIGLGQPIAQQLDDLIAEGYFPPEGYANEVAQVFHGVNPELLSQILTDYKSTDFGSVTDFGRLLLDVAQRHGVVPGNSAKAEGFYDQTFETNNYANTDASMVKQEQPSFRQNLGTSASSAGTSSRMQSILDRTGYKYEVTSGQRSYGPGPGYENFTPPRNCQCYFGKIPMEFLVEDLVDMFEKMGTIFHMRLMMNPETGKNQTYGFVTFLDPDTAQKCVQTYNGYDCVMPGTNRRRRMIVNISEPNRRLFVGPVPKTKTKEEIWSAFASIVDGICEVIVQEPAEPSNTAKNKGFCFLDFTEHKLAAQAKKRLETGKIPIQQWRNFTGYGSEWADPLDEPDEETMSKVKNLYITKLTDSVTEDDLTERFTPYGNVERVRKVNNYAFIHFTERENCMKAMEAENGQQIKDAFMKITLAKPVSQDSKDKMQQLKQKKFGGNPAGGGGYKGGAGMGYPSDYGYADDYGYDQYAYDYGYGDYDHGYGSYYSTPPPYGSPYGGGGYSDTFGPPRMPPMGRAGMPPRGGPRGFGSPRGPPGRGRGDAGGFGSGPMRGGPYGAKRPFGGRGGPPPKRGRGGF